MPILPAAGVQTNERLAALGLDAYPSSTGDVLDATAEDAWTRNPTPSLFRFGNRLARGFEFSPEALVPEGEDYQRPKLSADEANAKYGIEDQQAPLKFTDPVDERTAQELHDLKRDELRRRSVFSRAQGGFGENLGQFVVGLGVSALDPLNIASAFIPVVGQARYALWLERYGTTAARALRGGAEGAAGAALLEPIVYGVAKSEQADYDLTDSLLNLTFGTALGGGLHVGLGALGDHLRDRQMTEPLLRDSVAAVSDGAPLNVADSLRSRLLDNLNGDFREVFRANLPEDIRNAVVPDARVEATRGANEADSWALVARTEEARNRLLAAQGDLDRLTGRVALGDEIRTQVQQAEAARLDATISAVTDARRETNRALATARDARKAAESALERAEGRANTLRDAGVDAEDRKLARAAEQEQRAREALDAAQREEDKARQADRAAKAKRDAAREQKANFEANAKRGGAPELAAPVERAKARVGDARQALAEAEAELQAARAGFRDRLATARQEARMALDRRISDALDLQRLAPDEAREVAAIDGLAKRADAGLEPADQIAAVQEDLAELERQIATLPEAERATPETDEAAKASEARAKGAEAAANCLVQRGTR